MTLEEALSLYPGAKTFLFGDSERVCNKLLCQVRHGAKTATCGALRASDGSGLVLPRVGRKDIALNWDLSPALLVQTTDITIKRFSEVDEDFARAEGGRCSLEAWRQATRAYFERNGGFNPHMKLVCERFRLLEDFKSEGREIDCARLVA